MNKTKKKRPQTASLQCFLSDGDRRARTDDLFTASVKRCTLMNLTGRSKRWC